MIAAAFTGLTIVLTWYAMEATYIEGADHE